jgi:hypothetical protein
MVRCNKFLDACGDAAPLEFRTLRAPGFTELTASAIEGRFGRDQASVVMTKQAAIDPDTIPTGHLPKMASTDH